MGLTGQRFGGWTVIRRAERRLYWVCQCDCGVLAERQQGNLKRSYTKWGCRACYKANAPPPGLVHGQRRTRLYGIWQKMLGRCRTPTDHAYKNYGGRGIAVAELWQNSFLAFRSWALENGYRDNLEIDRRDNNRGYEPSNCRWVDDKTQSRNRRVTIRVVVDGAEITLAQLADVSGVPYRVLHKRVRRLGWPADVAARTPVGTVQGAGGKHRAIARAQASVA
jgi:hypothetical protein